MLFHQTAKAMNFRELIVEIWVFGDDKSVMLPYIKGPSSKSARFFHTKTLPNSATNLSSRSGWGASPPRNPCGNLWVEEAFPPQSRKNMTFWAFLLKMSINNTSTNLGSDKPLVSTSQVNGHHHWTSLPCSNFSTKKKEVYTTVDFTQIRWIWVIFSPTTPTSPHNFSPFSTLNPTDLIISLWAFGPPLTCLPRLAFR